MIRKRLLIVPFVALIASACAAQQSVTPAQEGVYNTEQLLPLMDRDQNGKVSRAEFTKFMNAEFDLLDVNKDGELDVNELTQLRVSPKHPGGR